MNSTPTSHDDLRQVVEPGPDVREPLPVLVIRSGKRRKTAQARLVGRLVEIRIPAHLTKAEEDEMVTHFRQKFERNRGTEEVDLEARASVLATELALPMPTTIRWVSNQRHRWGSCTPADGTIRLSNRMAGFPDWVIDYVIVHEMAHLIEPGHSEAFWSLVARYSLSERARGFLIAKGWDGD